MNIILIPFLTIVSAVLNIYAWIVIARVIVVWLVSFNVINTHHNFVITLIEFLFRTTEPVLMKIRRFLPLFGGFDFSPLVLILILWFLQAVIGQLMLRLLMVGSV